MGQNAPFVAIITAGQSGSVIRPAIQNIRSNARKLARSAVDSGLDGAEAERLMIMPLRREHNHSAVDTKELLDFLYKGLFASGYGADSLDPLPGFDDYVHALQHRLLNTLAHAHLRLGSLITPTARALLRCAAHLPRVDRAL